MVERITAAVAVGAFGGDGRSVGEFARRAGTGRPDVRMTVAVIGAGRVGARDTVGRAIERRNQQRIDRRVVLVAVEPGGGEAGQPREQQDPGRRTRRARTRQELAAATGHATWHRICSAAGAAYSPLPRGTAALLRLATLALALQSPAAAPAADRFAAIDPAVVARARAIAASAPSEQLPPPRTVDVLHYAVHLDLDPAAGKLTGRAEIELRPAAMARRSIALDADLLQVTSVQQGGVALTFGQAGSSLDIDLGREVAPEETLRLELTWSAAPVRGLFFIRDAAGQCTQIWSQNQCRMASAWFPCRDYPDDRASSELFVTLPDGWRTISNGVLIESGAAGEGRRCDHWRMDFPHPAYLMSLCAGPFAEIDLGRVRDLPLYGYAPADRVDHVAAALQPTGAMLERLEQWSGLPFPFPVYRQVAVAGFPWGGMENIAASTLDQDDLRRADDPADTWGDSDALVMHELAHQWFGNLLTPAGFADLWLAEGFATLAELDWVRQQSGEAAALAGWFALQERLAAARRAEPRPIVSAHCVELDDLFTPHAYEGGAAVLRQLEATLGAEAFATVVKGLVQRAQNRSLSTAEVEALAAELAGRDLSTFCVEWLHSAGQPELECEWQHDAAARRLRLMVHQKQQGEGVPEIFHAPLAVAFATGAGRRTATLQLDARRNEVVLDCDERPRYVHWNVGATLPGIVTAKQAPAEWRAALAQESDPGGRITAARALALAWPGLPPEVRGSGDDERAATRFALMTALIEDALPAVRVAAAAALGELRDEVGRAALANALWDGAAAVRAAAATALGRFERDEVASGLLVRRLQSERVDSVRTAALEALGALHGARIAAPLHSIATNGEAAPALRGPAVAAAAGCAELPDEAVTAIAQTAVEFAAADQPDAMRRGAIVALGRLAGRSDRARERLLGLLDDPLPNVRAHALAALDEANLPATSLPPLVAFHDRAALPDQRSHARTLIAALLDAD